MGCEDDGQHAQHLRFVFDDENQLLRWRLTRRGHTTSLASLTQLLQFAHDLVRGQLATPERPLTQPFPPGRGERGRRDGQHRAPRPGLAMAGDPPPPPAGEPPPPAPPRPPPRLRPRPPR